MVIKTVTLVRVAMIVAAVAIVSGLGLVCLPGCAVVSARYEVDKDGKRVMVEPERLVPAPITINAYPTPPVIYIEPVVYDYTPVVYRTYYPAPVYYLSPIVYRRYYGSPVIYTRPHTVIVGGRHGHRW